MKHIINKVTLLGLVGTLVISSCDSLDRPPLDQVSPDKYLNTAEQLSSYTINLYALFPGYQGAWGSGQASLDNGTDNQAAVNPNRLRFSADNWKVSDEGSVGFRNIRNINYFINETETKLAAKSILGSQALINQSLGEAYFFRAYDYFSKLEAYGDYPIITKVLPDEEKALQDAAKRMPRNEVARFIIQDIEKAIELLPETTARNQRISKRVAHLFLSRVALYEATFEKYHQGSGRVPGDANWPGKDKEWNKGKTFNIAEEIKFFLGKAVASAKIVADAVELTANSGVTNPTTSYTGWNPYYDLFASTDLAGMPEALLWRQYGAKSGLTHHTTRRLSEGAGSWTRGLVNSFLMANGLPTYANASGYTNDNTLQNVKQGRDQRLQLFMFAEDDALTMANNAVTSKYDVPRLLEGSETKDITGYRQRKLYSYRPDMNGSTQVDETATIIFRAAEAYLNYIEASYLLNGNLTADARAYWEKLRVRAGIQAGTIDATIAATDMSREANTATASYDWGAFSKGAAIDATLYSIRRERRCEFAGEGYRWSDLVRWRALDQVKNYQIEGMNFWGGDLHTKDYFKKRDSNNNLTNETRIISDGSASAQISDKNLSVYLRPYQIQKANNDMYQGYTFYQSHYLSPFSYQELILCSPTGDAKNSNLYQTHGWKAEPNTVGE